MPIADEWLLGGKQRNGSKPGDKNNLISTKNGINKAMRTRKGWKLMVAKTRRPLAQHNTEM